MCDSMVDCPGGEDEEGCQNTPLSCPGMFRCSDFRCIPQELLCDGTVDVLDQLWMKSTATTLEHVLMFVYVRVTSYNAKI